MSLYSGSADDALVRLGAAEREVREIRKKLESAESDLKIAREIYASMRPLTEAERDMLAAHVLAGGSLCCADGRAWLLERLPTYWAKAINGWAYEHLGCNPPPQTREAYANIVRALKLDRLPEE